MMYSTLEPRNNSNTTVIDESMNIGMYNLVHGNLPKSVTTNTITNTNDNINTNINTETNTFSSFSNAKNTNNENSNKIENDKTDTKETNPNGNDNNNGSIEKTKTKTKEDNIINIDVNSSGFGRIDYDTVFKKYNYNETNIKQWKYIFFQHIRKNGGTMVCELFYRLNLTTKYYKEHNCKLIWKGYPVTLTMSEDEYIEYIQFWKDKLRQNNIKADANEFSGFPLIEKIDVNSDIFLKLWSDILTIANLRDPIIHDLSEVIHGQLAKFEFDINNTYLTQIFKSKYNGKTPNKGLCFKNIGANFQGFNISSVNNSIKIVHCIKSNIQLTYNPYIQIFSSSIPYTLAHKMYDHKLSNLIKYLNNDALSNAKKVLNQFDVILNMDQLDMTLIQFIPFNLIPNCSFLWNKVYFFQKDEMLNDNENERKKTKMLNDFQTCYQNFVKNNITVVEPHSYIKKKVNYNAIRDDVYQLIVNYTQWDRKLYQFAKDVVTQRYNKVINGQFWK